MSRCFPYPLPGYSVKINSTKALIESIKLQKEREETKAERKKEKKEKKERKREKESNANVDVNEFLHGRKRKLNGDVTQKWETERVNLKSSHLQKTGTITSGASTLHKERETAEGDGKKGKKSEKNERKRDKAANAKLDVDTSMHGRKRKLSDEEIQKQVDLKSTKVQNAGEEAAEQLERSGITEEHDPPVCSHNPCHSSDSTGNSNKRRQMSPVTGIRVHGNVIRIRLHSQNHEKNDAKISLERPCSTSGRTESTGVLEHNGENFNFSSRGTDACMQGLASISCNDQVCSTSGVAQEAILKTSASSSRMKKILKIDSLYKELVERWVPPPLQNQQTDLDEEDWLFKRKHQDTGKPKPCSDAVCARSTMWPQAQHLAEVDLYALPFTVPF